VGVNISIGFTFFISSRIDYIKGWFVVAIRELPLMKTLLPFHQYFVKKVVKREYCVPKKLP
jgi:hypothetical protein